MFGLITPMYVFWLVCRLDDLLSVCHDCLKGRSPIGALAITGVFIVRSEIEEGSTKKVEAVFRKMACLEII